MARFRGIVRQQVALTSVPDQAIYVLTLASNDTARVAGGDVSDWSR